MFSHASKVEYHQRQAQGAAGQAASLLPQLKRRSPKHNEYTGW
jgi:hypothetical protein